MAPEPLDAFAARVSGKGGWVAAGEAGKPLGFAVAGDVEGVFWLEQISVDPNHGRQGIGTALLKAVLEHARWAFYSTIMLSTFRKVPFNRPWYERHGFMEANPTDLPPDLLKKFMQEVPPGVLASNRLVMVKRL